MSIDTNNELFEMTEFLRRKISELEVVVKVVGEESAFLKEAIKKKDDQIAKLVKLAESLLSDIQQLKSRSPTVLYPSPEQLDKVKTEIDIFRKINDVPKL